MKIGTEFVVLVFCCRLHLAGGGSSAQEDPFSPRLLLPSLFLPLASEHCFCPSSLLPLFDMPDTYDPPPFPSLPLFRAFLIRPSFSHVWKKKKEIGTFCLPFLHPQSCCLRHVNILGMLSLLMCCQQKDFSGAFPRTTHGRKDLKHFSKEDPFLSKPLLMWCPK